MGFSNEYDKNYVKILRIILFLSVTIETRDFHHYRRFERHKLFSSYGSKTVEKFSNQSTINSGFPSKYSENVITLQ